jgi:hypothetical protein
MMSSLYFMVGDALLWLAGWVFIPAHTDEAVTGFVAMVAALVAHEARIWLAQHWRGWARMAAPTVKDRVAGVVAQDRASVSERVLAEAEIRKIADDVRRAVEHQYERQIKRLDHRSAVLSAALIDFLGEQAAQELIALAGQTPGHDGAEP